VARPKPGMGRGLQAILSVSAEADAAKADELRDLPLELIAPSPTQPRRRFDEDALQALAGSLGERGVLQPVLVRPKPGGTYELVAGERRWRAAQIAGLASIPALVRPRGDSEAIELALIENMAREDLNPVEEARACAALVEELDLTREEVGRRVGRSRVAVSNLMRLLDLPDEAIARARTENDASGPARPRVARGGRASGGVHPDQEQAAREIAEALGAALGADVSVKATRGGGYRAELSIGSVEEAIELARRLRPRAIPGLLEHSR
jgi:ParB family chromosome partitioning protein